MGSEYPESPRVAIGGVVFKDGGVLLVRRAKPPAFGEWAIPGGSVELGETLKQAVEREVREETGITVRAGEICYTFEAVKRDDNGRVQFHYVIIDLLAEYLSGEPSPASDVTEAAWLTCSDLADRPVNASTLELLRQLDFVKE
jgi:ADP-ribose pyrophosphatase